MPKPFDPQKLDKRLRTLGRSKDSIQSLSLWIIYHKRNCDDVCRLWLNVMEKSEPIHRLTLFYVANDVLQHCKKRNAAEFRVAFAEVLEDAIVLAKNNKMQDEVLRIIKIWKERNVYSSDYLAQLTETLSSDSVEERIKPSVEKRIEPSVEKRTEPSVEKRIKLSVEKRIKDIVEIERKEEDDHMRDQNLENAQQEADDSAIIANFKTQELVDSLQKLIELSKEVTEKQQKLATHADFTIPRITSIDKKPLADSQKLMKKLDTAHNVIESYLSAADEELSLKKNIIRSLQNSQVFFNKQQGEVKHVAHAYRIFGKKLKSLQQKLNDKISSLPEETIEPEAPDPDEESDAASLEASPMQTDDLPEVLASESTESSSDLASRLSGLIAAKCIPSFLVEKEVIDITSPVGDYSNLESENEDNTIADENIPEESLDGSSEIKNDEEMDECGTLPEKEELAELESTKSPVSDGEPIEKQPDIDSSIEVFDDCDEQLGEEPETEQPENEQPENEKPETEQPETAAIELLDLEIDPVPETEPLGSTAIIEVSSTDSNGVTVPIKSSSPALNTTICSVAETTETISSLKLSLFKSAKLLRKMMPSVEPPNNVRQLDVGKLIPFQTLFQVLNKGLITNDSTACVIDDDSKTLESMDSSGVTTAGSQDDLVPMDMDLDSD